MDKVMTIHDWWDGPRLGLATFQDTICLYERAFSEELDDYTDFYDLTPLEEPVVATIMENWQKWIGWMEHDPSAERAMEWYKTQHIELEQVVEGLANYRKYQCQGVFSGTHANAYSSLTDYFVTWQLKMGQ